jgi:hypothetical protein
VGRDVLAGCLGGGLFALVAHIVNGLPAWFHLHGQTPIDANNLALGPLRKFVGIMLSDLIGPIIFGLTMLFLFFLLRTVIRRFWLAVLLFAALNVLLLNGGQENVVAETIGAFVLAIITIIVLIRFGLLGLITAYTVQNFLQGFPVALDPSRWYFARGLVPVLLVLALALYAFRTSLGSRPLFPALAQD